MTNNATLSHAGSFLSLNGGQNADARHDTLDIDVAAGTWTNAILTVWGRKLDGTEQALGNGQDIALRNDAAVTIRFSFPAGVYGDFRIKLRAIASGSIAVTARCSECKTMFTLRQPGDLAHAYRAEEEAEFHITGKFTGAKFTIGSCRPDGLMVMHAVSPSDDKVVLHVDFAPGTLRDAHLRLDAIESGAVIVSTWSGRHGPEFLAGYQQAGSVEGGF